MQTNSVNQISEIYHCHKHIKDLSPQYQVERKNSVCICFSCMQNV